MGRTGPVLALLPGSEPPGVPQGAARYGCFRLAQVLAGRSSLLILAAPIGIALGAPLATIALGLVTIAALLLARRAG